MPHTTSTPTAHYPSRSPPHTTQGLSSAMPAQLSRPIIKHDETRGESGIEGSDVHRTCSSAQTVILRSRSSSPTSSMIIPSRESHSTSHNSNVTDFPALSRWQCIPLPSQTNCQTAVVLHSLLLCPRRTGIHWSISESHDIIKKVLEERWHPLKDLATHPALPALTVVHTWLPWPITVHASGMDARGVTVADVLLAISRDLAIVVDESGKSKRMDFLRGKRMFVGLQESEVGGDVWELVVE
ncbi:hypothetical protein E1B28_005394 [Marasmius oreades]|uniref:DUF6699 domain-containing protein n=1 Tax=Marasmius oreades TaxID=181124 RepID=A0A9P7S4F8_9AGAR|nr:uncharacterized protein E1B28_005394 [Marasmius oreades]KAG7094566.1 hypothetical protein E1B28_005394 [Marasmius oreades]